MPVINASWFGGAVVNAELHAILSIAGGQQAPVNYPANANNQRCTVVITVPRNNTTGALTGHPGHVGLAVWTVGAGATSLGIAITGATTLGVGPGVYMEENFSYGSFTASPHYDLWFFTAKLYNWQARAIVNCMRAYVNAPAWYSEYTPILSILGLYNCVTAVDTILRRAGLSTGLISSNLTPYGYSCCFRGSLWYSSKLQRTRHDV